jgi:hypothetical protein
MPTTDYELGYADAEEVCRGYDLMDDDHKCSADYLGEVMETAFQEQWDTYSEEYKRGYRAAWAYWTEEDDWDGLTRLMVFGE